MVGQVIFDWNLDIFVFCDKTKFYWNFCFNWLCLTSLQKVKQGVPPHYCQVEGKVQVPYSSSVDTWWQKWGWWWFLITAGHGGISRYPCGLHWHHSEWGWSYSHWAVAWYNPNIIRKERRERHYYWQIGLDVQAATYTVEDASLPAGSHEGPSLVFSDINLTGVLESSLLELHAGKVWSPHLAFAGMDGHSFFSGVWLE